MDAPKTPDPGLYLYTKTQDVPRHAYIEAVDVDDVCHFFPPRSHDAKRIKGSEKMISLERSQRLYGSKITEGDYAYFRGSEAFLISICATGGILQILQAFPGTGNVLEMVAAFVYLAYNIFGMLLVRVSNVAFKFEDATTLRITIRMALSMALYGLIIFITLPTFQSSTALQLMGVFGVVNVLIILPTNIFENLHVLSARSRGVGLEKAKALTSCQSCFVSAFITTAYLFLTGTIVVCLALLGTGPAKALWTLLTIFYVGINIIPILLPKVQHLVLTEVRTWPLKVLTFQFAYVIIAVLLIGAVLSGVKTSRRLKIVFGILGVANGVIVSIALTIVSLRALYHPRTAEADAKSKDIEEAKATELTPR